MAVLNRRHRCMNWSYLLIRGHPIRSLIVVVVLLLLVVQYIVNLTLYHQHIFISNGKWTLQTVNNSDIPEYSSNYSSNYSAYIPSGLLISNFDFVNGSASINGTTSRIPLCPLVPPNLLGINFKPNTDHQYSWEELTKQNPTVHHGGWYPTDCIARETVAVIIPYRNRDEHLRIFISNIHPFLQRQQLNYRIFIVEQAGSTHFNRASLFNIGFLEASKLLAFTCFVFHDVDLIPEHDHNMYRCGRFPRHMSAAVDKFNYKLPYKQIFGGVCAVSKQQFLKMNGYSNIFFGWGGEDDDFSNRVGWAGFKISRYKMNIAKYKMIKHKAEKGNKPNPHRFSLIKNGHKRWPHDGVKTALYSVNRIEVRNLVIWINVDIPEEKIRQKWARFYVNSSPPHRSLNLLLGVLMSFLVFLVQH